MNNPFISIVVPVYNVHKYLQVSIQSILNQDYDNYEIILVDDGSTDDSPKICDSFALSDDRIRVIHKTNAGQGEARNSGLDISHGDYVFFMDSDDTIQKNTLSNFVEFLNTNGDFDIVGNDFQNTDEKNRNPSIKVLGKDEVFDNVKEAQNKFLKREIIFLTPGTFYNVNWLKQNGLRFKKVPYSEDQLFIWEALTYARRVGFIHKTLYNYLQRPGSIMSATKFEKIVAAYPYFNQLQEQFLRNNNLDSQTRQFMLSRWLIGLFHSAAKLCSYKEYINLIKWCDGDYHIKNAQKFPDFKVKILTIPYRISTKMYYHINRLL